MIFSFQKYILGKCKDKKYQLTCLNHTKPFKMKLSIRKANAEEANLLTEIAFAAKRTWKYPEEYFDKWANELTITESYINEHAVFVASYRSVLVGFYSLVTQSKDIMVCDVAVEKGFWMDHLFVLPKYQKKGIGKQLLRHTIDFCNENWIDELKVFVDPHAIGFYENQGARFVRNSPSSIEGREIPIYVFYFDEE